MKINSKISLAALSLLSSPIAAHAETCGYQAKAITIGTKKWPAGSIIPCGKSNISSVSGVIIKVTDWVLGFAGAVAVLFIIWGGLQYMTAAGNEKRAAAAKQTLTYAVVGVIVILLAKVIVVLVSNTVSKI